MDEHLIQSIIDQYDSQQAYAYTPNVPFDTEHRTEFITQLRTTVGNIHQTYQEHLSEDDLASILDAISNEYDDLANINILDWQHENIRNRCCELYSRVRKMLKDCGLRKPGMRAITTIISSVFGSIPVITKEMVRGLHYLGLLPHDTTESFRRVWDAINNFFHENWDSIANILIAVLGITEVAPGGVPIALVMQILYYAGKILREQLRENQHHHRRN